MKGYITNYRHPEDGRQCMLYVNGWRHAVPCDREHPSDEEREVDLPSVLDDDRGEFGMPTVGAGVRHHGDMVTGFEEQSLTFIIKDHEVIFEYGEEGQIIPAPTPDAQYILEKLPDIIKNFLENNQKYKEVERGYDLGDAGIIPDINRKVGILVSRIWHKAPAGRGESTEEVIGDLIGHLLLLLAKRRGL